MSKTQTLRPRITVAVEQWPLQTPFRITGYTIVAIDVVVVMLEQQGHRGRGEAAGVYYRADGVASMVDQLERVRIACSTGIDRRSLQQLLPVGGARNALDCALWDLEAQLQGCRVWQLAELAEPRPRITTFTCGADLPEKMAAVARGYQQARAIKLKLTGEPVDAQRVMAVREARPDVWLGVDANQGCDLASLERLMPVLQQARVELIEQPFRVGDEAMLEGFCSPIPVAADESVQGLADLPALVGRFDMVNIKLDKCGGLTEALAMVRAAHELGLRTMVGNMVGTSLAMAPAWLVGQLCEVRDLDGPIFLAGDRDAKVVYADGMIRCPPGVWG